MLKSKKALIRLAWLTLFFFTFLMVPSQAMASPFQLTYRPQFQPNAANNLQTNFNLSKVLQDHKQRSAAALVAKHNYKPGQLIVKFKDSISAATAKKVMGTLTPLKKTQATGIELVKLAANADMASEISRLRDSGTVEYVEPNYIRKAAMIPNDTYYSQQWALSKINAPQAWDITQGSSTVTVAVLDTGIDASHPDLAPNILPGYNFINSSSDTTDDNGHGTFVSGIIAASINNNAGVAGLAGNVKILPLKIMDSTGTGDVYNEIQAIGYAMNNGAKVINLSLAGGDWDGFEEAVILNAVANGVTVVAAAGNDGNTTLAYPASYPCVISVGATDSTDNRASFSNYNSQVDVVAPGQNIASTLPLWSPYGPYGTGDGTSFAAPYVSALAALLLSEHPTATPGQVEQYIKDSAVDLGSPGRDNYYGWGRIDAYKALTTTLLNGDSFEPNDPTDSLSTLPVIGAGTYNATVYPAQDVDIYRVTVSAGQNITVRITPPSDLNIGVYISDSNDKTLSYKNNTLMGGVTQISAVAPTSGTYYIDVSDVYGASSKLPYTMQVSINSTGIWNFQSNGVALTPSLAWLSGPNSLPWQNCKEVAGDFNGDGRSDIAVLYNYGNNTSGIWLFLSNSAGTAYSPILAWKSGTGSFSWANSKLTAGDVNGDGKDDLIDLYNYGSNTSGLWSFISNGTSFTPKLAWKSNLGAFSWNNSKLTGGDFNGDGKDDAVILYNYGKSTSGLWPFISNGTSFTPRLAWKSGIGGYAWERSNITAADLNGDRKDDVAILYDYGSNTTGIWNFASTGASYVPKLAWKSNANSFAWANSKLAAGDVNGDGKDDLTILYNYGNGTSGLWSFISNGTSVAPRLAWKSAAGQLAWDKSLLSAGDFNGDKKDDIQVFYNFK